MKHKGKLLCKGFDRALDFYIKGLILDYTPLLLKRKKNVHLTLSQENNSRSYYLDWYYIEKLWSMFLAAAFWSCISLKPLGSAKSISWAWEKDKGHKINDLGTRRPQRWFILATNKKPAIRQSVTKVTVVFETFLTFSWCVSKWNSSHRKLLSAPSILIAQSGAIQENVIIYQRECMKTTQAFSKWWQLQRGTTA